MHDNEPVQCMTVDTKSPEPGPMYRITFNELKKNDRCYTWSVGILLTMIYSRLYVFCMKSLYFN